MGHVEVAVALVSALLGWYLGVRSERTAAIQYRLSASGLAADWFRDLRWLLLDGLHELDAGFVREKRVLLFDDLFRSGATMNSVSALLTDRGAATAVYALTLTRTRSAR